MAGAGKKTFTAGEILTASDTNTYLMEQTVMNFAGTASRASAIPTPSTGMTSYIGVTGTATIPQIETYTGSAWQTPYGSTLLANVTVSSASTVAIDNVFSSTYSTYLVYQMLVPAAGNPVMSYRFRDSGGDVSASNYVREFLVADSTTVSAGRVTTTSANNGQLSAGVYSSIKMSIHNPNVATTTSVMSECSSGAGGAYIDLEYVNFTANTVFTGISFFPGSSTMTGNIRIYGLRNS
jgi:hypothetical protein